MVDAHQLVIGAAVAVHFYFEKESVVAPIEVGEVRRCAAVLSTLTDVEIKKPEVIGLYGVRFDVLFGAVGGIAEDGSSDADVAGL